MDELIRNFENKMHLEGKSEKTIKIYVASVKEFFRWFNDSFGDVEFKKLYRENILEYKSYLKNVKICKRTGQNLNAKFINAKLSALIKYNELMQPDNIVISKADLIKVQAEIISPNFATIINDLFCCEDKNEYIDALVKYDLLIIDDLGAERGTEYAVENVFNVIDRRYRSGKPLIITTNLHISMLTNEQSLDKKRIYDRILELCIPICVNGASKRTATAKEKMKEMQEIAKSYQKGGDAIE